MCLDPEVAAELAAEELADLADALELESQDLANLLFEQFDDETKRLMMQRVIEIEQLLKQVKAYIRSEDTW